MYLRTFPATRKPIAEIMIKKEKRDIGKVI